MVNQAARNKKKKAKKQAAARGSNGNEAEQDAYLAAAHAQAQLERERLALEQQRRVALVEAAAAAEFQQQGGGAGRQLQHGQYHVAPDGTVYDEHGELIEDEDDEEEEELDDEEDDDDEEDEDEDDEDDDDEEGYDDEEEEDEELQIEVDHRVLQEHQRYLRQQQRSNNTRPASSNQTAAVATHEALLGTANDLYKQIESAAAAALSGAHGVGGRQQPNAGSNNIPQPPSGAAGNGEEDDAYWLSLPSHLRSFIRSALPLAAGLSTSPSSQQQQSGGGNNPTAQQINLTPDQMAAAAAQLAQVVQNGWASTLAKEPLDSPLRSALLNAQQQQANAHQGQRGSGNGTTTTTTTIPLGAFALPLHPHPDSPEAAAAFQAAAQAAAQAAVGSNNQQSQQQQGNNQPFPSLANLQASLLQLAKMPPGDLASQMASSTALLGGNPFAPMSPPSNNNAQSMHNHLQQQQQYLQQAQNMGESKSSSKKKKKKANGNGSAPLSPAPAQAQPPPPAPVPTLPLDQRHIAPLRGSRNPQAKDNKPPSPLQAKMPAAPPARVATPNNGKQPAVQPSNNGKAPLQPQQQQQQQQSVANGKQPAVTSNAAGKARQMPPVSPVKSPVNNMQQQQHHQQQQQQYQQHQPDVPVKSAVANGKRPLVATKSAVPVVPSAPAKSVTGNTINNPPAPPPVAQHPHDKDSGKKRAQQPREATNAHATANTAYGGGASASSSTSSSERAKIRDFWLTLSERDRRELVKVEKDSVLKKMKEQQRHGCSCAVCTRKRQAIEVELEVLYDAYYDELESYAHHQKAYENSKGMDPRIPPPIGPGPFPGSVDIDKMLSSPVSTAPPASNSKPAATHTAAKKTTNTTTAHPAKGKTQPPPPAPAAAAAKAPPPSAAPATNTAATTTQSKDKHSHSPSCPHYPHTHDHKHHHHHAPTTKDRGKATQTAPPPPATVAARKQQHHHHHHHHHDESEDYASDEEDYDDEDDEGEYDDEDDYDGEDDIPETDEEDMPPLEGMDSADETPPQQPPQPNANTRRGAHPPPPAQTRRNTAPPPKAQPPAPVAKKGAAAPPNAGSDFFGFGSSLTVKGILTVAEDLLKNDGQKFLEMMESLADKRIQRERAEEDGFSVTSSEFDRDEEEYDDEEDEEGDEEDEDELEDEEGEEGVEEPLTEEQKMEEGRKMFQVFAARMFEQRVLTAYREMVAQERQNQLLRELEEEDRQAAEREAKRAKDAQKKKEKKKLAKQQKEDEVRALEEEKKQKEQEAAELKAKAEAEEQRRRADERAKREAENKAKELEAVQKEAKKARLAEEAAKKKKEKEERAREARLQKEKEEAEKRAKRAEEKERKDRIAREAREAKEKELAEKKAQAEKEKAEREKKEKEEREKQEKEAATARAAAAASAARASPVTIRQQPGQPSRSVSGKVIPGMPKTAAPPMPSPAPHNATLSMQQQQYFPSSGPNGMSHGIPSLQTPQSKQPGQASSQRSFSNTFISGPSAASPPGTGRPAFGTPTFGQQPPIGFSSGQGQNYPQTSFGTIDALSPNHAHRPGMNGPPGIPGSNRNFSPMPQHHQQQQQQSSFGGPPGMQVPPVSPMASQRSPFTSFGSAGFQSGAAPSNVNASPFMGNRGHANGIGSSMSPGSGSAHLGGMSAGQQQHAVQTPTQPMPIGHGHPSSTRLSPIPLHAGSSSLNGSSASFQHSASGLAALNMDSQVVSRSGPSQPSQTYQPSSVPSAAPGHARKASQSGVNPIGRPGSKFGGSEVGSFSGMGGMSDFLTSTDEDLAGTSASSLRSISPPPAVLGSGALLDDMLEDDGFDLGTEISSPSMGSRSGGAPPSSASFFGNSVFGPPAAVGTSMPKTTADDVWASTPASSQEASGKAAAAAAGWSSGISQAFGASAFQPPVVAQPIPDRSAVIRDRAKIAFTQLDTFASRSGGPTGSYPIGDVFRVFQHFFPDSTTVDLQEFAESCLVPGTTINGNGTFGFEQQGPVLLMKYDAVPAASESATSPFGVPHTLESIGSR